MRKKMVMDSLMLGKKNTELMILKVMKIMMA